MKQYINTSNYYLGVLATDIDAISDTGTFEVDSAENEHVTLPLEGFFWLDVDFTASGEREIFRITKRVGNTLTYDKRISPTGKFFHGQGAVVGLRDFAQLFNMLASNSDNFGQVEQVDSTILKVYGGNVFVQGSLNRTVVTKNVIVTPNNGIQYLHFDSTAPSGSEFVLKNDQDPYLYLLASVTTDTSSITGIEDLRGTFIGADLGFLKLNGSESMEGDLDMGGYKIKNAKMNTDNTYLGAEEEAIAGFDNSKHLISLSTATYPNLTELSYLKGVTSNIQNQLDGKGDVAYNDFVWVDASSGLITIDNLNTKTSSAIDLVIDCGSNIKPGLVYMLRVTATADIDIIPGDGVYNYSGVSLFVPSGYTKMFVLLATSDSELEFQGNEGGYTGNKIFTTISEVQAGGAQTVIVHGLGETPKTISFNGFIRFGDDADGLHTASRVLATWTEDGLDFLGTVMHFSDGTQPGYPSNMDTFPMNVTVTSTAITLSCTYYCKMQITAYL